MLASPTRRGSFLEPAGWLVAVALILAAACSGTSKPKLSPSAAGTTIPSTSGNPSTTPGSTVVGQPTPTTGAGTSTATSTTAPDKPQTPSQAFVSTVSAVTAADLPSSWRPGCPVAPQQLRLLHLSYWGFDATAHVGIMVVNAAVTSDVVKIFGILFQEHFPIHQMQPVDAYQASDTASMAADNTSGFNCRNAVAPGPPQWSVHAYGEAIDVNTVENPYILGGVVTPPAGAAFLNRSDVRPGMAVPGGQLVLAFAAAGWQWGGRWTSHDYQHFSKTGG